MLGCRLNRTLPCRRVGDVACHDPGFATSLPNETRRFLERLLASSEKRQLCFLAR